MHEGEHFQNTPPGFSEGGPRGVAWGELEARFTIEGLTDFYYRIIPAFTQGLKPYKNQAPRTRYCPLHGP